MQSINDAHKAFDITRKYQGLLGAKLEEHLRASVLR
jgi:hypothetical protein